MKRFVLCVLLLLLTAVAAYPQAAAVPAAPKPAGQPGTKIGVVIFATILRDSDPGLAANREFDTGMASDKTRLDKLSKEMADLQDKLQNAKTDAEKSTINRQIDDKNRELQRASDDAQRLQQDLQDRLLPAIVAMINKAVDSYAVENGYALIVDPTTEGSNVIYASPASDITSEILRRVNAEHAKNPKAAAPAAAPASTPASGR